jgi:hypothetical protein
MRVYIIAITMGSTNNIKPIIMKTESVVLLVTLIQVNHSLTQVHATPMALVRMDLRGMPRLVRPPDIRGGKMNGRHTVMGGIARRAGGFGKRKMYGLPTRGLALETHGLGILGNNSTGIKMIVRRTFGDRMENGLHTTGKLVPMNLT